MKKVLFTLLLVAVSFSANAQITEKVLKKTKKKNQMDGLKKGTFSFLVNQATYNN